MSKRNQIIFVYNADAGWGRGVVDSLHKMLSPSTYNCALCALTHSAIGPKRDWKDFVQSLDKQGIECLFLHRNELKQHFASLACVDLPAVFGAFAGETEPVLWLDATEFSKRATTVDELQLVLQHFIDNATRA